MGPDMGAVTRVSAYKPQGSVPRDDDRSMIGPMIGPKQFAYWLVDRPLVCRSCSWMTFRAVREHPAEDEKEKEGGSKQASKMVKTTRGNLLLVRHVVETRERRFPRFPHGHFGSFWSPTVP